jgi:hypothetical protein
MTFNDRRLFSTNSNANSIDEFQWQFDRRVPMTIRSTISRSTKYRKAPHPSSYCCFRSKMRWHPVRVFPPGFSTHCLFSVFEVSFQFFSYLKKELKAYLPYLFALFTSETFMQHFPTLTHPSTVFYSKVSLTQSKQYLQHVFLQVRSFSV